MTDRAHRTFLARVDRALPAVTGGWWQAKCHHCPWTSPPQAWPGIARDLADRHEQTA